MQIEADRIRIHEASIRDMNDSGPRNPNRPRNSHLDTGLSYLKG